MTMQDDEDEETRIQVDIGLPLSSLTSQIVVYASCESGKYAAKFEVQIAETIESTLNELMQAAFDFNTRFFVYYNGQVVKISDTFWSLSIKTNSSFILLTSSNIYAEGIQEWRRAKGRRAPGISWPCLN